VRSRADRASGGRRAPASNRHRVGQRWRPYGGPVWPVCALVGLLLVVVPARAPASHRTALPPQPLPRVGRTTAASAAPAAPSPASPTSIAAPLSTVDPASGDAGGAGAPDPLADNGFSSPLCREPQLSQQLSARQRAACGASGTAASSAPIGNYAFDIHIDTGLSNLTGAFPAALQDFLLTPVWIAVVWLTHALVIAFDWAYSLDLLGGSRMGTVARTLRHAEGAFTGPWLAPVLAAAAIATTYRGLVQRRVSETMTAAASMALLMVVALGLLADPDGTVGGASRWVNQASLGSLAAISGGSPARPQRSLADGTGAIFDSAVNSPWCYLEFGDVAWCRDRRRLDPALRLAARRLAQADLVAARCHPTSAGGLTCDSGPAAGDSGAQREIAGVRLARTNGELFLAFPANGPARNSINDPNSLLRILCNSDNATACHGPTVAQAEFRTGHGTLARAGGLLLICIGAMGMLALLAFLAIRLVGAALLILLYLLLTPLAVLAPALGETGRAAFRAWGTRLLGALIAKLIYSVYLGAVLLAVRVLDHMGSLGWWTQWMLIAALWWVAFQNRGAVLGLALVNHRGTAQRLLSGRGVWRGGAHTGRGGASERAGRRPRHRLLGPVGERLRQRFLPDRESAQEAGGRAASLRMSVPGPAEGLERAGVGRARAVNGATGLPADPADVAADPWAANQRQGMRLSEQPRGRTTAPERHRAEEAGVLRDQLARVEHEQHRAAAAEDRRRELRLRSRAARLRADLATAERDPAQDGQRRSRWGVRWRAATFADLRKSTAESDVQTALGRGVAHGSEDGARQQRDYPRLAALAGLSAMDYRRLEPAASRRARIEIDRQLEPRAKRQEESPARRAPGRPGGLFEGSSPKRRWQLGPLSSLARHARSAPRPADARRARARQFGSVQRPVPSAGPRRSTGPTGSDRPPRP